jgi:hypothetical protein
VLKEKTLESSMRVIMIVALFVLAAGCKDKEYPPTQPIVPSDVTVTFDSIAISDELAKNLVYSDFKTPPGFYREPLGSEGLYYENSLSILPNSQRTYHWFELSTNDRDLARRWSESTAVNSSYYRYIESESETDKYFQFRRIVSTTSNDIVLSRVHKLSYVDRSMYDFFNPSLHIATLNVRPLDTASVRAFAEYYWFTHSNYNTSGAKALATVTGVSADSVICVLYDLQTTYGDWGLRDQIGVYRKVFTASTATGNIIYSQRRLRNIQGHGH